MTITTVPDGFRLIETDSPFINHVGPFFEAKRDGRNLVGAWVQDHHLNLRSYAHGGFLLTLADLALTRGSFDEGEFPPRATLSLTAEMARPVKAGLWVEAELDVIRVGKTVSFVACDISSEGKRIAHASGVFRNVPRDAGGWISPS